MITNSNQCKDIAEKTVRDVRRHPRHRYSTEDKVCFVMEGLQDEASKRRLAGNTIRAANSEEVKTLR